MKGPDPASSVEPDDTTRQLKPDEASQSVPVERPRDTLAPGSMAGSYVIGRPLGSGGGGIVYTAEHQMLKRKAAVKVLRRGMAAFPSMVTRFHREATTVNMIRHPNIVDIFDLGQLQDGRPYYVMELLEGTDLRKYLHLYGRFAPEEALSLLEPVCLALDSAHKAGVVHRDLKASNIFVGESNGQRTVKLVDFGIAKLLAPEPNGRGLTEAGAMLGTWHNMAPEQVRCEQIDSRADIYALGVLLYQLLTGHYPFQSNEAKEITWMHLTAPVPRPSQSAPVSAAIDAVVLKAMEKQRDDRFATTIDFLDALRDACGIKRDASADEASPAMGIYVELRNRDESGGDTDDAMLEDMANALDLVESAFRETQVSVAMQTGNALLGVRALDDELDEAHALALAQRISDAVAQRPGADERVHVNVALRFHHATIRESGGAVEVIGGDLLDIEHWAPPTNTVGLAVSRGG